MKFNLDNLKNVGIKAFAMFALFASLPLSAAEPVAKVDQSSGDILWLVLCSVLVFFMQAGFALLESGLTRSKNAVNIMSKNFFDFCMGALIFWAIGYAIMYGESGSAFIGWDSAMLFMSGMDTGQDNALSAGWLFQIVFAATAATIVSGAMAGRTKLFTYILYSALITAFIYPITGHWIWGGDGWLSAMGMRDFAGSTVVHSVGAWAALAGVLVIGPRIGKYGADGKAKAMPGHNIPLAALGTFILWFGWYGFNAGSTLALVGGISHVAVTTTLSAAAGTLAAMAITWFKFGKPDLTMGLNGCLAGLVGITAGCASVSASSAVLIGLISGIIVFFSCILLENKFKIDDPVGAISVHGVCGIWGTLAIGLFGQSAIDVRYWDEATKIKDGLFFGGGVEQLGIQAAGVFSVLAYTFIVSFVVFKVLHKIFGLRVSEAEEKAGLDNSEHGMAAYPETAHLIDLGTAPAPTASANGSAEAFGKVTVATES